MKRLRYLAKMTCSYNVLHRHFGPMHVKDIARVINKAIYEHYGSMWGV